MPIRSRYVPISAAIGLVLVVASCNKSPTSPRPPQGPSSTVTTVRLELVAPSEIAPGETVQLTANAVNSDGSVKNVSSQSQWTPTDSPVLQLSSTGLATGRNRGEQVVSVRFSGLSANARIFVLPKGTFRLAGTVKESGFGLENVVLTVISGMGEGLTTLSGFDGTYTLYGVSGLVQVEMKKEGYLTSTQQIDVTAHRTQDFTVDAAQPRKDYAGTYMLTITAASSCRNSGTIPDEARRRVYTAKVRQDGGRLTVTLTDANFIVTNGEGNGFVGLLDPSDGITFAIGDPYCFAYYDDHFQIVERFGAGALIVVGNVAARGDRGLITGTLAGAILISTRTSGPLYWPYSGHCYAQMHRFEMVRR